MAATAHLVRGSVLPSEVNPVAGFNNPGAYARAATVTEATQADYASAAQSATEGQLAIPTAPVAAQEIAGTRPLSDELPEAFRAGIQARRDRIRRGDTNETAAQRRAREGREASALAQAQIDGLIRVALSNPDGEYPHGCLVGRHPVGNVPFATVRDAALAGGVKAPDERSAASVAREALDSLKGAGYEIAVVRRGSAWTVYRPARVTVIGESIGSATVTAALASGELQLTGPDDLCAAVRAVWDAARAESRLTSAEVTSWLGSILDGWRAVPTAYGRFLPPGMVDRWRTLAGALADAGLPVARRPAGIVSYADVQDEIAAGLRSEIDTMLAKIRSDRDAALAKAKSGDLGSAAAATACGYIADTRAKLSLYETIIGSLDDVRTELAAVESDLAPLVSDVAARGAMLEMS